MKSYNESLKKIDSNYVRDNYIKLMLQYKNYLMLYGNKDLMYYNNERGSSYSYKNAYLSDIRKDVFPDSDVIEYYDMSLFKRKRCANQILDFNKDYIKVSDGVIYQITPYKAGDDAYIYTKILNGSLCNARTKSVSRMEIANYLQFGSFDGEIDKYAYTDIIDLDGNIYNKWIDSEDSILDREKEELVRIINSNRTFSNSVREELLRGISRLDMVKSFSYPGRIMIKLNNNIEIEYYSIKYLSKDNYEITLADFPVTKESLAMIKSRLELDNIKTYKMPKRKEYKYTKGMLK